MKFFKKPSPVWFGILSEFFVNLGAGWFGIVLFDPFANKIENLWDVFLLTFKIFLGILSLIIAKVFRKEASK